MRPARKPTTARQPPTFPPPAYKRRTPASAIKPLRYEQVGPRRRAACLPGRRDALRSKAIPRNQLDPDKSKLDQAQVAYDQALQQAARRGFRLQRQQRSVRASGGPQVAIVNAQTSSSSFTRIVAPFDGTSKRRHPDQRPVRALQSGDAVTAGQALFTIAEEAAISFKCPSRRARRHQRAARTARQRHRPRFSGKNDCRSRRRDRTGRDQIDRSVEHRQTGTDDNRSRFVAAVSSKTA